MPDTTATPAPAPRPMSLPRGGAALTLTADAFTRSCMEDLAAARAQVAGLARLDPVKAPRAVLEQFDAATALAMNVAARASVARNAHPDKALREAAEKCEQEAEKYNTDVGLDRAVYDVLAAVDLSKQDGPTRTWISRTLREMRRLGVDKDEATRAKVKALSEELTLIGQEFGRNIVQDVRTVEFTPRQLDGLPADYLKAHPVVGGKVKISTDTPDYVPVMAYAKDGKTREQLWRAYRLRGHPKNLDTLQRLIGKRHELATLLGYPSWAAYVTETKMIGSAEKAAEFIDQVNAAAEGAARRETDALLAFKRKDVPKATALEPWDQEFYEDLYKAGTFGFDSQKARPYFEYTKVLAGVLDVTSTLFGITYTPVPDAPRWHPDVRVYDVRDTDGTLRGRVYLDMHPRADKYKHAAQFDLVTGQAGRAYAEGVLMCNFPQPGEQPALMQPREVETFFHEFGHLLHHVLGGGQRWAAQSGVKTEWDFVEAPSMMLQEWAQNGEALARFARHHETGEAIPAALVQQMVAAKEFGKGLQTRRQMFLSAVSLNYYNRAPGFDPLKLATELQQKFLPFRREMVEGTYFPLAFGHLEGYSAIYYTYIWSSVIAKDLLTVFDQEGWLNPAPAGRYRKAILEAGGSDDAANLVKAFLGRESNFQAYGRWLDAQPVVPAPAAKAP
ncbi:MAG: hypothetical protein RL653_4496 [Pseudomonadota bacterium]